MGGEAAATPTCECKVGRVARRHDVGTTDAELRDRWVRGEASLRELADAFNVEVLRSATQTAGMTPLDGELENLYRLLTDDEVTSGTRTQARNRLERADVDVDALREDFVSHQTVHTHLRGCLGADRSSRTDDPAETARQRVRSLQSRMEAVTADAVTRIDGSRSYDVYVDVAVVCEECGRRREFGDLVDHDGCDCG